MKPEAQKHLARAEQLLAAAESLIEQGFPPDSVSRSYYAMFHAATAVLLELGIQRSSHYAMWAAFGQFVVHPGLIATHYHRAGLDMASARADSDYLAEPEDTLENARDDLAMARDFVAACHNFLDRLPTGAHPQRQGDK